MANGDVVFFGYPTPSRSHAVLVIILIIINSHAKPLPSLSWHASKSCIPYSQHTDRHKVSPVNVLNQTIKVYFYPDQQNQLAVQQAQMANPQPHQGVCLFNTSLCISLDQHKSMYFA